jgi:hypothetical protein
MKPFFPSGVLLLSLVSAAESTAKTNSNVAQWERIAERLRVEFAVTNFTEFTNHPCAFLIHSRSQ